MKLYTNPASPNCKKVIFAANLLKLPLETEIVDLRAGKHKTPEFKKLNPNSKVPVLQMKDGTTMWESNAIVNRLAAEVKDSPLWPPSNERYNIMRWQFWEASHWSPACGPFISKYAFGNESVDLVKATAEFERYASVLDDQLANNQWVAGQTMTLADVCVAPILMYREHCKYPVAQFKNINRWLSVLEALPEWKKSFS